MYIVQEYICHECESSFESLVKREEINQETCPKCHQSVDPILSAPKGYVRGTRTPVSFTGRR